MGFRRRDAKNLGRALGSFVNPTEEQIAEAERKREERAEHLAEVTAEEQAKRAGHRAGVLDFHLAEAEKYEAEAAALDAKGKHKAAERARKVAARNRAKAGA